MTVWAYAPDLMDRSKFGDRASFVASPGGLASCVAPGDLVVVDLSRAGVLEALALLPDGVRTIGFGSHVDRSLLEAATAAGCQTVLPRSKFFASLPTLLTEL